MQDGFIKVAVATPEIRVADCVFNTAAAVGMARRAAQSDEVAQTDAQTAPRRRRAPQQKPRTYSDYVSGETVERLPEPPQWPQVQQAAEAAKKPKKGLVSRVAKMMEEDDGNEIAGINALPPRVSKDEAYHPAKTPQKNGKRKR